jgi:hypothetical protein
MTGMVFNFYHMVYEKRVYYLDRKIYYEVNGILRGNKTNCSVCLKNRIDILVDEIYKLNF